MLLGKAFTGILEPFVNKDSQIMDRGYYEMFELIRLWLTNEDWKEEDIPANPSDVWAMLGRMYPYWPDESRALRFMFILFVTSMRKAIESLNVWYTNDDN